MTTPGPLPTQQAEQAPVLELHDQLPAVPPQRPPPKAHLETVARWPPAGAGFAFCIRIDNNSTGIGKTIVVFFSVPNSARV